MTPFHLALWDALMMFAAGLCVLTILILFIKDKQFMPALALGIIIGVFAFNHHFIPWI